MPYRDKTKRVENDRTYRSRPEVQQKRKQNRTQELLARKERRFLESPEQRESRLAKEREIDRRRPADRVESKRAYRRAWYRRNVEKQRLYERARRVGVGPEEIERLRRLQGNCCALCRRVFPEPKGERRLRNEEHIDHDHVTGRIRGILCGGCNTSIGKLGDNQEGLSRALHYVSEPADPDCF